MCGGCDIRKKNIENCTRQRKKKNNNKKRENFLEWTEWTDISSQIQVWENQKIILLNWKKWTQNNYLLIKRKISDLSDCERVCGKLELVSFSGNAKVTQKSSFTISQIDGFEFNCFHSFHLTNQKFQSLIHLCQLIFGNIWMYVCDTNH